MSKQQTVTDTNNNADADKATDNAEQAMTEKADIAGSLPAILKGEGTNDVTLDVAGMSLQLVFQNKEMAREHVDTIRAALAS